MKRGNAALLLDCYCRHSQRNDTLTQLDRMRLAMALLLPWAQSITDQAKPESRILLAATRFNKIGADIGGGNGVASAQVAVACLLARTIVHGWGDKIAVSRRDLGVASVEVYELEVAKIDFAILIRASGTSLPWAELCIIKRSLIGIGIG